MTGDVSLRPEFSGLIATRSLRHSGSGSGLENGGTNHRLLSNQSESRGQNDTVL